MSKSIHLRQGSSLLHKQGKLPLLILLYISLIQTLANSFSSSYSSCTSLSHLLHPPVSLSLAPCLSLSLSLLLSETRKASIGGSLSSQIHTCKDACCCIHAKYMSMYIGICLCIGNKEGYMCMCGRVELFSSLLACMYKIFFTIDKDSFSCVIDLSFGALSLFLIYLSSLSLSLCI